MPHEKQNAIERVIQSDTSFKGAYARSLRMVLYANQKSPEHLRNHVCKEAFVTLPVVVYTRKDFYLLYMLNMKLELLKNSGLINYWQRRLVNEEEISEKERKRPRKLELYQLQGCFYILLFGCMMSSVSFVIEIYCQRSN